MKKFTSTLVFSLMVYSMFGGDISGPDRVCAGQGGVYKYTETLQLSANERNWSCQNCEIWNPTTNQWVTYLTAEPYGPNWTYSHSPDFRFESGGTSATIYYSQSGFLCPCFREKTVYFGGPSESSYVVGMDQLMNCGSYTNSYNIYNMTTGYQLWDWTTSSGLTTVTETPTYATVKPSNSSVRGSNTVNAKIRFKDKDDKYCSYKTKSKQINVISPYVSITGTTAVCAGNEYTYTADFDGAVNPVPGASFQWTNWPSGWTPTTGTTRHDIRLYVPQYNPSGGVISVTASLPCGNFNNGLTVYPIGCSFSVSTYPNPSSVEMTVEIKDADELFVADNKLELIVLDFDGKEVLRQVINKPKNILNIRRLKKGIYFLNLLVNDNIITESKRIQIN